MTPAASKNNVYFMWDFVGRTLVSAITLNIHTYAIYRDYLRVG